MATALEAGRAGRTEQCYDVVIETAGTPEAEEFANDRPAGLPNLGNYPAILGKFFASE